MSTPIPTRVVILVGGRSSRPSAVLPSKIKIIRKVSELQVGHEIKLKKTRRGDISKSMKARVSFLYVVFYISTKYQRVFELQSGHKIYFKNKNKGR